MEPQPAPGALEVTTRQFFPDDELGIVAAYNAGGDSAAARAALEAVARANAATARLNALAVLTHARLAPPAGWGDHLARIASDPVGRVRLSLQWYLRSVIEAERLRGREFRLALEHGLSDEDPALRVRKRSRTTRESSSIAVKAVRRSRWSSCGRGCLSGDLASAGTPRRAGRRAWP